MAHKVIAGQKCPRCGSADVAHPTNYGKPQKDRGWCLACGSLWTLQPKPKQARAALAQVESK